VQVELAFTLVQAAFTIYSSRCVIDGKFGGIIVFPAIDKGTEGGSDRIDRLLPFCRRFSHIVSLLTGKHEPARRRALSSGRSCPAHLSTYSSPEWCGVRKPSRTRKGTSPSSPRQSNASAATMNKCEFPFDDPKSERVNPIGSFTTRAMRTQ
jgi:hypothetical protein